MDMQIEVNTVKLRAITMDVESQMASAELLAHFARISNPSNEFNHETGPKLLKTMAEKGEWSPFEQIFINMEIYTTRDISRQILRHRSFFFQEFSQRYANPVMTLGWVTREARLQDKKNRQSSIELGESDQAIADEFKAMQDATISDAHKNYARALDLGIAKEQARVLLPEGLTLSRLYMVSNVRNWIHYINLRAKKSTQKEHRLVAIGCRSAILKHMPILSAMFMDEEQV